MAGTITTTAHCAFNPVTGKGACGSKRDIVFALGHMDFDSLGRLTYKHPGFKEITLHSYSDQWLTEEKWKDAAASVYQRLPEFGYRLFRDIGF